MEESFSENLKEFKEYCKQIEYLNSTINILYWDARVAIPKKGVPYRSEVIAYLAGEIHKLQTSDKIKKFIDYFKDRDNLDDVTKAMVLNAEKNLDQTNKIPEEKYMNYVELTSNAESVWEEAREKSDFQMFEPYLEKIVDYNKDLIRYWGYKHDKYDALVDLFEQGMTTEKLDVLFGKVKETILSLLTKIKQSNVKSNTEIFNTGFTKKQQEDFSKIVVKKMGFDFEAGRIDVSAHPFTIEFSNKDVRITTNYNEDEFRSALFSCIHEAGHALYEQDIPDSLIGTLLCHGVSMGIHESQSRFYENIIGRSEEFWEYFYPILVEQIPHFKNIGFKNFYNGINAVVPSLIRTEADELTYSLHVIIRYEIEKELFNDEIKVSELPQIWNKKYKEYLGVDVPNDAKGVLQDAHWAGGSFGYFPSYALGNLYGAQFLNKMQNDIPDMEEQISKGNLEIVHKWLKDNIHKYGSTYTPEELIKKVTGEELKAEYFIQYLNKKYTKMYNLK